MHQIGSCWEADEKNPQPTPINRDSHNARSACDRERANNDRNQHDVQHWWHPRSDAGSWRSPDC